MDETKAKAMEYLTEIGDLLLKHAKEWNHVEVTVDAAETMVKVADTMIKVMRG